MKKLKKIVALVLAVCLVMSLTACGVNIESIAAPPEMVVRIGETADIVLEFVANKDDAAPEDVAAAAQKLGLTWSCEDESIATVNESGQVTGVAMGETLVNIASADGKVTACVKVIVEPVVESIDAEDVTINTTDVETDFVFDVLPTGAEPDVLNITVADESIATVKDGKLTAVAAGETELTITADDISKTVKVTVLQAPSGLSADEVTVEVDKTSQIAVNIGVEKADVGTTYTYESEDEDIAIVDEEGKVTGVNAGETSIKVDNELGQSCEVKVTVTEKADAKGTDDKKGSESKPSGTTQNKDEGKKEDSGSQTVTPAPAPTPTPTPTPTPEPTPNPTPAPAPAPTCPDCGSTAHTVHPTCGVCGSKDHTSHPTCGVCGSTDHTSHPTCPTCGSTEHTTHPQEVQHYHGNGSDEGYCPVCNLHYSPNIGNQQKPGFGEEPELSDRP